MNPKAIRQSLGLTQHQMSEALGLKLRQYKYLEAGARTTPTIQLLLEFIQETKIIAQKFKRNPKRASEGDPSKECRYCFGFIGVGDVCYFIVDEKAEDPYFKYQPFCSIKCAFSHKR